MVSLGLVLKLATRLHHCGYHSYKHVYEGGRRGGKLVYSCGENGDCPPRRSAHRSWVVGSSFAVGGRGKGQGASLPLSPTTNEGFSPHLQWVRGARHLAPTTHHKWGIFPSFAVGERGRHLAPLTHHKWGSIPSFAVGERGEKCKKADSHRYHQFEWQIAPRPCFVNKTLLEIISHIK